METKTIVTLNENEVNEALVEYLHVRGYKAKDKDITYLPNLNQDKIAAATVEVEVLENSSVTKLE